MVGSKIMQPKVMEVIREQLVRLEILIRLEEEVKERSIIYWLKEAMKSVVRDESLYISLVAKLSERLEAAKETIVILKRAVTNISNGVVHLNLKCLNWSLSVGQQVTMNLRIFCGTWSNTLML